MKYKIYFVNSKMKYHRNGMKKCKIWQVHQHSVHVYLYIFAHNMPQNRNMYVNNCLDNLTEGLIAQHV